jgi:hypothetical protein
MIKLKDILFEGKLSKSEIKKMKDKFDKTGKLPPHLQKLADLMKKNTKVKDIVVPGLEWMAEGKLTEGKYFQKWQEHLKNLEKLYVDVHHAKKAIPHKKKELLKIEKHYKELHKLVPIIVGQMVDEGKLKEAKETIFDVAEKVLQDKQMHVYKSSKGKVKVDLQTANLLVKVFKKVNPKMLKILINLGFKDPAQLVQTLWAVVK